MLPENLNFCTVRINTHDNVYADFPNPIKACEAMGIAGIGEIGTYQTALNELEKKYAFELVHYSKLQYERAKRKKKNKRKAERKGYNRENLAPTPKTGKPMQRLNMSVSEITQKPVESSKNWKKAAEIARKENKQAKALNSSDRKPEKSNVRKPAGLFPESIKVTKSKVAAKRAKVENEYIPSTNNEQFKEYKGKNKRNKRGQTIGIGTQTNFL
jgi:hypothetical protein